MTTPENLNEIFQMKSIAVVGMSPNPERPSYKVAIYLNDIGYTIFPVNPGHEELIGKKCYPHLFRIPYNVDIVCVFRKSIFVLPIAEESIQKGVKTLWLQDGIINEDAAELAKEAGILVVMDDCIMRHHQSYQRN